MDTAKRHDGLFFIVGTGRCGSTLLQSMLTSHSRVVIPAETHFFSKFDPALVLGGAVDDSAVDRYLDACERERYWADLGIGRDELDAAIRGGARDTKKIFEWMLGRLSSETFPECAVVGEKTPHHEKFVSRILDVYPDARFISIYRDPRDVVASLREMPWRGEDSALLNARRCRKTYERQSRYARELGAERFTAVRYETLVAETEGELRRLCAFLGIEFEEQMLRYYERGESGYLGAEESWKGLTKQPIDASRQGRYKKKLSAHQIATVERTIGGDVMRELGYEFDSEIADRVAWRLADIGELAAWQTGRVVESLRKRVLKKR